MRMTETSKLPAGKLGDTLTIPRHIKNLHEVLPKKKGALPNAAAHRKLIDSAPDHAYDALIDYTDKGFKDVNQKLRKAAGVKKVNHHIAQNLTHLTRHHLGSKTNLYRGVGLNAGIHRLKKGDTFTDHGFTSTTTDANFALGWAPEAKGQNVKTKKASNTSHKVVAHIVTHPKTKGLSYGGGESEVILHPGTKFKVLGHSVHKDGDGYTHVVHMHALPHKD